MKELAKLETGEGFRTAEWFARLKRNCGHLTKLYEEVKAPSSKPMPLLCSQDWLMNPLPPITSFTASTPKSARKRSKTRLGWIRSSRSHQPTWQLRLLSSSPSHHSRLVSLILLYASNNKFRTEDVRKDFKTIAKTLSDTGFTVLGLGSDGDIRALAFMKESQSSAMMDVRL